jgi:hypothetical protein
MTAWDRWETLRPHSMLTTWLIIIALAIVLIGILELTDR